MYYRQYQAIKSHHPNDVLLFRIGDFYETFGKDARILSKVCGIALISKRIDEMTVHTAGFPRGAVDDYLARLIDAGLTVAIADGVTKTDKDVTRLIA